jgi:hypothetical protein
MAVPLHRPYAATVRASHTVTVSDIAVRTSEMLDAVAKKLRANRSFVARCILEAADQEEARRLVLARLDGGPRAPAPRPKMHHDTEPAPRPPPERPQDVVCRELRGAVPAEGCRYPYCGCRT